MQQIYFIVKTYLRQIYETFVHSSKGVAKFGLQGNITRYPNKLLKTESNSTTGPKRTLILCDF